MTTTKLSLISILLYISGCAVLSPAIEQADASVVVITSTVKAALIDNETVDAASIHVHMNTPSSIILSGFVGSKAERHTAIKIAEKSYPSLKVVEQLEVR